MTQQLLRFLPLVAVTVFQKFFENGSLNFDLCVNFSFSASVAAGLRNSEIMKGRDPSYQRALANILTPVMQSNSQWRRCWRASLDGWAAGTFHSLCDDKGPTVTIVGVGQYIFGAYTRISWGGK